MSTRSTFSWTTANGYGLNNLWHTIACITNLIRAQWDIMQIIHRALTAKTLTGFLLPDGLAIVPEVNDQDDGQDASQLHIKILRPSALYHSPANTVSSQSLE